MCGFRGAGHAYHAISLSASTAEKIGYEGWITVMLAGITVLVTLLGMGLAVVAVFGYSGVKEAARDAADKAARDAAERVIKENKDKWLKDMGLGLQLPIAEAEPAQSTSNVTEQVGQPYPNEPGEEAENVNGNIGDDAGTNNPTAPKIGPS